MHPKHPRLTRIFGDIYKYGYASEFSSYDIILILFDNAQFMPAELSIKVIIY